MLPKTRYKSVNDGGTGNNFSSTRIIGRLRSLNLFRKNEERDVVQTKQTDNGSQSSSNTTSDLSPIKEDENDSCHGKFDPYFASSYLPHVPVAEDDTLDLLVNNPSIHCQAFAGAGEMEVPPPPPHKARTRRKAPSYNFVLPQAESESTLRPKNLIKLYSEGVDITKATTTAVTMQSSTAVTGSVTKRQRNKVIDAAKQHLVSLGNDVIAAVEHSHSDLNEIFERMSSDSKVTKKNLISEQDERVPSVIRLDTNDDTIEANAEEIIRKKTKVSQSMDDIKSYFFQLQAGVNSLREEASPDENIDARYYQQNIRRKMGLIAKSISAVTPDVKQALSCENHMCWVPESVEGLMNPTLLDSDLSPSPLEKSWLTLNEDSDTVSKLSMPFNASELSMSMASSVDISGFEL